DGGPRMPKKHLNQSLTNNCELSARILFRFVCLIVFASLSFQLAQGMSGERTRLGQAGDWRDTLAAVTANDRLFTVETNGALYVTDLTNGSWVQLGKADFVNTRFLFAHNQYLITIESDGSCYRVSQTTGGWIRLGKPGDWKETIAGTMLNGKLYTVE